jgi:hypothetical protein
LGEDGLIVPWRPYDPAHHVTCDTDPLERASDGPCIAVESLTFNWVFVGDECRTPVVSVEPQCARPPLAAFPTFSCPRYYSLAETPWTAASTCSPQPPPGTVYALESFLDPVWLTRAVEPAPTREQPIYVAGGSVRFRDPHRLFDADLITECEMSSATRFGEPARDGEDARCRPPLQAAYYKGSLFSDAACTQPLPDMVQVDGSDMCITRSPATYLPSFDGVFRIGARHEGVVYEMLPPTCNPVLDPLHELGELLPDTRLPHAIKRRDP